MRKAATTTDITVVVVAAVVGTGEVTMAGAVTVVTVVVDEEAHPPTMDVADEARPHITDEREGIPTLGHDLGRTHGAGIITEGLAWR